MPVFGWFVRQLGKDSAAEGSMPRFVEICRRVLFLFPVRDGVSVGRLMRLARKAVFWKNLGVFGAVSALHSSLDERLPPLRLMVGKDRTDWPCIDLSVVTFCNSQWIGGFIQSLSHQEFPLARIRLLVCDHSPGSDVLEAWEMSLGDLRHRFAEVILTRKENRGFGAGHNVNIGLSESQFVLVSNVDLEFASDTLTNLVATALGDTPSAAAWECRQTPYEHPKYYDPRTLETQWCSAAACLYRTESLRLVSGFDETFFMYGEDVELSFALRAEGYGLRYVPSATVVHHSYGEEDRKRGKPHQVYGSAFAHIYICRTYVGLLAGLKAIPLFVGSALLRSRSGHDITEVVRGLWNGFQAKRFRKDRTSRFRPHLSGLDYEFRRTPPWIPAPAIKASDPRPLVSIIMRTFGERREWAREALRTVSYQTYRNLEVLLVEDGTNVAENLLSDLNRAGISTRHICAPKKGRCYAGNVGLAQARGDLMMFLDDDDGLFADHVETLVDLALRFPNAPLVYSNAIRIFTQVNSLNPLRYEERAFAPGSGDHLPFSRDAMLSRNLFPIQAALFRRETYEAYGGFDLAVEYLEDWNLWVRYMKSGDFVKSERVTSYFRVPDDLALLNRRTSGLEAAEEVALAPFRREPGDAS